MEALKGTGRPLDSTRNRRLTPLQLLITRLIEQDGMTLTEIACEWGVGLPELSKWRRGISRPSASSLARLVGPTKLSVAELVQ